VELLVGEVDPTVQQAIGDYLSQLDDIIAEAEGVIGGDTEGIDTAGLERLVLRIPLVLYYCQVGSEKANLSQTLAELIRADTFNSAVLDAKGTDTSRRATAEITAQESKAAQIIYQSCSKMLVQRMYYLEELLKSIKKILSLRITEYEVTRMGGR
jgi:hypothetical protein